ncbi:MAG: WD40/YVTN/BNR-like repeat-containing protein [Bacteroidota bacterium]
MRAQTFIFSLLLLFILSCKDNSVDPETNVNDLFKKESNGDTPTHTIKNHKDIILAGTDDGVFKKSINKNEDWHFIGLSIDSAKISDIVILDDSQYLALGYANNPLKNPNKIYRTSNEGNTWKEDTSTAISAVKDYGIYYIEKNPNNPDEIYTYRGYIIKSVDGGNTWNLVYDGGIQPYFLSIDPYHPNQIWTGGSTHIFTPWLAKSSDSGANWTYLHKEIPSGDADMHDVILHPDDSDKVLAGLSGPVDISHRIIRSTDGGENWEVVSEAELYPRTFEHSVRDPKTIYVSGSRLSMKSPLMFAFTNDFGNAWEFIEWEDGPTNVGVYDMLSVMEDGKEVLYFATTKGLYSYTFEE